MPGRKFLALLEKAQKLQGDDPKKIARCVDDLIAALPPDERKEVERDRDAPAMPLPPGFSEDDPSN